MSWIGMRSTHQELWDYVSPFESREHVSRIYRELHDVPESDDDKIAQITAAFGQGRMYFVSAESAPPGVKPVLLYYGASALLTGLTLIRDADMTQEKWRGSHGLNPVGWREILYDTSGDILDLPIKSTTGTFRYIANTVWHGHIDTVFYGGRERRNTVPYTHRLGRVQFAKDGSCTSFADLVSRSRYTGGLYGTATNRHRSLLRGSVWMNPVDGLAGIHIRIDIVDKKDGKWLYEDAKIEGLPLLGPECNPYGAVYPCRGYGKNIEPDLLPVFHYEDTDQISVCESMPNGDKLSELIKLYLMAYIVGMVARYYPTQWLAVIRGTSKSSDSAMLLCAVTAIERNFVREFAGQLAVLGDDPHFFGEHFGFQARPVAPDWRCYIGDDSFPAPYKPK